jgi:hypothetical protein
MVFLISRAEFSKYFLYRHIKIIIHKQQTKLYIYAVQIKLFFYFTKMVILLIMLEMTVNYNSHPISYTFYYSWAMQDRTLMPESRCRTEAADNRKKCRCRTNFSPAFKYDFAVSYSKNNTISSCLWACVPE